NASWARSADPAVLAFLFRWGAVNERQFETRDHRRRPGADEARRQGGGRRRPAGVAGGNQEHSGGGRNRTPRTGITRPTRFEDEGAHQAPVHLRLEVLAAFVPGSKRWSRVRVPRSHVRRRSGEETHAPRD